MSLLNSKNQAVNHALESSLLQFFSKVGNQEPYTKIGELLNSLKEKFETETKAREFLDNCIKANNVILNEAFKKILLKITFFLFPQQFFLP